MRLSEVRNEFLPGIKKGKTFELGGYTYTVLRVNGNIVTVKDEKDNLRTLSAKWLAAKGVEFPRATREPREPGQGREKRMHSVGKYRRILKKTVGSMKSGMGTDSESTHDGVWYDVARSMLTSDNLLKVRVEREYMKANGEQASTESDLIEFLATELESYLD